MLSRRSRLTCRIPCARLSGRYSQKRAASSTASISGSWLAKPCRSCASGAAGMPYSRLTMRWRTKQKGKEYTPYRFPNGDTRKELLIRSRHLLFKSADKWTGRQKQRAAILFEQYPDIQTAYGLCHSLRMIFAKNTVKDAARLSMARWYNKVGEAGFHSFNVIAATFYEHYDEILNFYNNCSSNAMAESFNAKIKLFRANLRGVADKKFFLFRIANLYAYPH